MKNRYGVNDVTSPAVQSRKSKRALPVTFDAWIGFSDDKPHLFGDPAYYGGVQHGDYFTSQKAARRCYGDVRRVTITVRADESRKR